MGRIEAKRNSDEPCKSTSQDDCPWADQDRPASFPCDCDRRGGSKPRTHKPSHQRQPPQQEEKNGGRAAPPRPALVTRPLFVFSNKKGGGAPPQMRCRCRRN